MRKTYSLAFPADMPSEQLLSWVRTISGTIVPEIIATDAGIAHYLQVPAGLDARYAMQQLRTMVPGVSTRETTDDHYAPLTKGVTRSVSVGMDNPAFMLDIKAIKDLCQSVLASLSSLKAHEAVGIQLVLTPRRKTRKPMKGDRSVRFAWSSLITGQLEASSDEIDDLRSKLSDANFYAILRVTTAAKTENAAENLMQMVKRAYRAASSANTTFITQRGSNSQHLGEFLAAQTPRRYPMQLSATELLALMAWPMAGVVVPGIERGTARQLAASSRVPRTDGIYLGHSNYPGDERPIVLAYEDATMHLYIPGPTGSGKTTHMVNIASQVIHDGYGAIIIDTKGDMHRGTLAQVPKHRLDDVINIDLNDPYPVGFNILDQGNDRASVDSFINILNIIYKDSASLLAPQVISHGLHALAAAGGTLVDLPAMLSPQSPEEATWRDHVRRQATNSRDQMFWQRYLNGNPKEQDRMSAPVHNRMWQFMASPDIYYMLGQSKSTVNVAEAMAAGKILLVNIDSSRIGSGPANILASLFMQAIWNGARSQRLSRQVFLFLDEFQTIAGFAGDPKDMLAKARSYGLCMVLANQDLSQLPGDLRAAVISNARSKIIYQTSSKDAETWEREFGKLLSAGDFQTLAAHEAAAMVAVGTTVSPPFTMVAPPPAKPTGYAGKAVELSRATYGRSIADIDAEIEARRVVKSPAKKLPKPGRIEDVF